MAGDNSKKKWLEVGHELFALDGPDGIQVERLARVVGLNKSGFYHYFGSRDIYFEELLSSYNKIIDEYISEILSLKSFEEYLALMIKYRTTVLFHVQLSRNTDKKIYREMLENNNQRIEKLVIPLWSAYIQLARPNLAHKYFELVRDMFYCRVNQKNLNIEFLHQLGTEAQTFLKQLQKNET